MSAPASPPPAIPPPAGPRRSARSGRDMALALAVLLIPIVVFLGVYKVVFSGDAPIAVNAADTWATARHSAPFTVLEPAGLPGKWTVVSATYRAGTLRVGYVTPSGAGLQLVESDQPVDQLLPAELGANAAPGNLVGIGDRSWRGYPSVQGGNRALVLADAGRTTIVIGTATEADLRAFSATLR